MMKVVDKDDQRLLVELIMLEPLFVEVTPVEVLEILLKFVAVKSYLQYFAMTTPKQWFKCLLWAEFSYNTAYHTAA